MSGRVRFNRGQRPKKNARRGVSAAELNRAVIGHFITPQDDPPAIVTNPLYPLVLTIAAKGDKTLKVSDVLGLIRKRFSISDTKKIFFRAERVSCWGLAASSAIQLTVCPTLTWKTTRQITDVGTLTRYPKVGFNWARDTYDATVGGELPDVVVFQVDVPAEMNWTCHFQISWRVEGLGLSHTAM